VALPVWAYFYDKCVKDKSLAIDTRTPFTKPEGVVTDSLPDWTKMTMGNSSVEGGEQTGSVNGNASESDYGEVVPQAPPAVPPPTGKKDSVPKGTLPKKPNEY
jgi:hypothetical protein